MKRRDVENPFENCIIGIVLVGCVADDERDKMSEWMLNVRAA